MKKKILLIICFGIIMISLAGCGSKEKNNKKESTTEEAKEIKYETAILNEEVTNIKKEMIDSALDYEKNTKYYYNAMKSLTENNEYASQFVEVYDNLHYDEITKLEKDVLDYMVWNIFYQSIKEEVKIIKIWEIGYNGLKKKELQEKDFTGIVIEYNIGEENNRFLLGLNYINDKQERKRGFAQYDNSSQISYLPIDQNSSTGIYKNKYKDEIISALDGETYNLLTEEEINNINQNTKEIFNFLTKYHADYAEQIALKSKCSGSYEAISVAKTSNTYTSYLSSVKRSFHKILNCEQTNSSATEEFDEYFIVTINGTCSGYTDIYNEDFNIAKFDMEIKVNKYDCSTSGKGYDSDLKY